MAPENAATIPASCHHELFDKDRAPVLRIEPGGVVAFETLDACFDEVRSVEDLEAHRRRRKPLGNPITGPVYIEQATPGRTLIVDVLDIRLNETGFQLLGPNRGVIRDEEADWTCYALRVEGDDLVFPNGIRLPVDPIIGTMGNAPAGAPTSAPNRLGGNMDVPALKVGTRVHLPIDVPGGLFSLGDVHARQGDGEVVGAPEFGARVSVRLDVVDRPWSAWPLIEDGDKWHVVTCAATEAEAARIGVLEAARFLTKSHDIPRTDALFLLTMAVELHCARTGAWGGLEPVVCTSFPKRLVEYAALGRDRGDS